MKKLFPMGQIVATTGARDIIEELDINPAALLERHQSGDWGDLSADDIAANNRSVKDGTRILSAYEVSGVRLWIITEADRSSTTILLPEEY